MAVPPPKLHQPVRVHVQRVIIAPRVRHRPNKIIVRRDPTVPQVQAVPPHVVRVSILLQMHHRVHQSVLVAMVPVHPVRVLHPAPRVHTAPAVRHHVRMLVQVAMQIRLGQQPRVRRVVPQERMVQRLD